MADINVSITEAVQTVTKTGFGVCLLVDTSKAIPFKLYDITSDLSALEADAPSATILAMATAYAAQIPRPTQIAVFGVDLSASITKPTDLVTALNTLISSNNNWYRIALDDQTEPLIEALGLWSETNGKMFYTQFGVTVLTGDYSKNTRTILGFKLVPTVGDVDRLDCAMMGFAAGRTPGSYTFKFKNLGGITADALSTTQIEAAKALNMDSYYEKFAVLSIVTGQVDNGTTASGAFIDAIESRDYVKATIGQLIAQLITSSDKIPFDDLGIQQVVTCVTTGLNQAFKNGIIAPKADLTPNFSISYPTISSLSSADIAARHLTGITFSYAELEAIHDVAVTGTVIANL